MKRATNKMQDPPRRGTPGRSEGIMRVRCVICGAKKDITTAEAGNLNDNPVCGQCLGPMELVQVQVRRRV